MQGRPRIRAPPPSLQPKPQAQARGAQPLRGAGGWPPCFRKLARTSVGQEEPCGRLFGPPALTLPDLWTSHAICDMRAAHARTDTEMEGLGQNSGAPESWGGQPWLWPSSAPGLALCASLQHPSEIFPLEPLLPASPCTQEGSAGLPETLQHWTEGLVKPGAQIPHPQSFPDGDWPKKGGEGALPEGRSHHRTRDTGQLRDVRAS